MATDLEAFIRERASIFDENLDVSEGSPFDVQVVQPILRRLGADPFASDFITFAQDRLNQAFPDLSTADGDAIMDLLIKPAAVLLDPILRETERVKLNLSFRDPTVLTTDEAEALGANLFAERERGTLARVVARIYFSQPQSQSINPSNFLTTQSGLHFFPTSIQSIRSTEMLLNQEGALYYFDINATAEKPGEEYNIGPDEIVNIANVAAAVRVTNKRRARFGADEETAVEFVDRAQQELTERSMVTSRGIAAKVTKSFPEVTRLAIVGFNDPEMQRDVLTGGGLGPIRASGSGAQPIADGQGIDKTSRLSMSLDSVDFGAIIGSAGEVEEEWVLTLFDGFITAPAIRDLTVTRVISSTVIEVSERVISPTFSSPRFWTLRKKEITVSGIPGGILFPDGPNGTVDIPDGKVHIGGTTDILVRGVDVDTSSVVISSLVDDSPILSGTSLTVVDANGVVQLEDYVLDTDYAVGDDIHEALAEAAEKSHALAILDDVGGSAGTYRILSVTQVSGASPLLLLDPPPPLVVGDLRWRLFDDIDIDLITPRETRISGTNLKTIQNTDYVEPDVSIDYDALGVSNGDTLRIYNGLVKGDYIVQEVLAPFYDRIRVDRKLVASVSNLKYDIFRANATGGINPPLVRVSSVDLLDTSGQPVGSTIPYAKAVDVRSSAFSNVARGVRADVTDVRLGIVSKAFSGVGANVSGATLNIFWDGGAGFASLTFVGANPVTFASMVSQINTAVGRTVASVIDGNRIGITPIDGLTSVTGTSLNTLFGVSSAFDLVTSRDIRSDEMVWVGGVTPPISPELDVVQVLDGFQIGYYSNPTTDAGVFFVDYSGLSVEHDFYPEADRHIRVGYRSVGKARVYFLEPTSAEFGPETVCSVETSVGTLRFFPDPTLSFQKIPSLPSGTIPKDGETTASVPTFDSDTTDFIKKNVRVGDTLEVTTIPVSGTVALTDPVATLALKTLIISLDGGVDKTITFIHDSNSIPSDAVTRAGVASQINRAAGKTICSISQVGGLYYLEFETESDLIIRSTGTANPVLGFSSVIQQDNDSPNRGTYTIDSVATHQLVIEDLVFSDTATRQMFKILRPKTQRISSTSMAANLAEAGLYYFDLELVSEGPGDTWNIDPNLKMTLEGYESDGYYLTTDDPNLSFSPIEYPRMVLSRSVLEVGVSDDPENATQLSGQNIQVNYEKSIIVSGINNFALSDTERVVNSSPLGRHLIPYFVRFDCTYYGGSKESEVIPEVETYIKELFPNDSLEVSDICKIISDKGATSITNPISLISVIHNNDRTVTLERSQDKLNTGRLAAFIPDILNIKRKTV